MAESSSQEDAVLIISAGSNTSTEDIIRNILAVDILPSGTEYNKHVLSYPWKCETKYYTAEVALLTLLSKEGIKSELLNKIKAIIISFDPDVPSSFEDVLNWNSIIGDIKVEVKLLLCNDSCNLDSEQEKKVMQWCVDNQYEFIELNHSSENDDEECSLSFQDAVGYDRVVQALHSNSWSSICLKVSSKNAKKSGTSSNDVRSATSACNKDPSEVNTKKVVVGDEELKLEEKWIENIVKGEDPDGECFEALFRKFASMKEGAQGLSGDARKKYAEEVAVAFWRAMGGDEDEIDGLDD